MKKMILVTITLLITGFSFAAFPVSKPSTSAVAEPKEQKETKDIFRDFSVKDYEKLIGRKMNFIERLKFKVAKRHIENRLKEPGRQTTGFNVIGFLLGFLLPPYGVIIAYIFSRDRNLRKWAWIGLGTVLVVGLLVLLGLMFANFK